MFPKKKKKTLLCDKYQERTPSNCFNVSDFQYSFHRNASMWKCYENISKRNSQKLLRHFAKNRESREKKNKELHRLWASNHKHDFSYVYFWLNTVVSISVFAPVHFYELKWKESFLFLSARVFRWLKTVWNLHLVLTRT